LVAGSVRAGALDRLGLYANVAARLAEHAVSIEDRVGLLVYAERTLTCCRPTACCSGSPERRHAYRRLCATSGLCGNRPTRE